LQSVKDAMQEFIDPKGIEFVKREDCTVCNYGKVITIRVDGELKSQCKYCEDRKLAKKLQLPTKEEYREQKKIGFSLNFERITDDLKDATVNSYKTDDKYPTQKKAKQAAIEFITQYDGSQSLVLSGVPGIGKSHLSYAINKAIRHKGYKSLFIKSTDLLDAVKGTYNPHSNVTQDQIFKMIDGLDLLVLDDLGGEYEKKNDNENETWASDVIYKVVDMRLGKSLITTTNYSENELINKYGQVQGGRIVSRMMDNAVPIRLEGEDLRRRERF